MFSFGWQRYRFTTAYSIQMAIFTQMIQNSYNVVGVMSGTSLDGIDLVHVKFNFLGSWTYQILAAETISYSFRWKEILAEALDYDEIHLKQLNIDYTKYLAEVISQFLFRNSISELHAICSHGHTIKHEPQNAYTLQIGNLPALADLLKQTVVCDFRVQDVNLGGQGAPLVPIGDQLLFPEYDFCLNLGGFANVSTSINGKRIAFDICAVNTVLNRLAGKLDLEYDDEGKIAAAGNLDKKLLKKLDEIPFYSLQPPKSLGIEWVNEQIFPIFEEKENIASALHTYVLHAGQQIGKVLNGGKVLVTGGGAFNSFLIQEIQRNTSAEIIIPSAETVNFKEALIFAFLGILKLRGEVNVLSSVTGAAKDHSSGEIFSPAE